MPDKNALVIGALLHDIGKFEFRANRAYIGHTTYGDWFVQEYLAGVACLQPMLEDIRRLVAHHHDGDAADPFLQEADHLAAAERQPEASSQTRRSLVSVLAAVDIKKGKAPETVYRYSPAPVDYNAPFPEAFPDTRVDEWRPDEQQMIEEHKKAWEAFCADIALLPDTHVDAWIESFVGLAHKHLSRVASAAYRSRPDITLYDHMRAVAATAVCLQDTPGARTPFLLIQGDISGIQSFLYKLASPEEGGTRQMAKRLRGRSFYIGLLAETIALYYLRQLDLPPPNLLYSSGGHFQILAPNTETVDEQLEGIERAVNHWLWDTLRGDLGLVCTAVPGTKAELTDFSRWSRQASLALGLAKRRKFNAILDEGLFKPRGYDQTMDVCPVCQADFSKGQGPTCTECQLHVDLGQRIVRGQYLIRVEGEDLRLDNHWVRDFTALGIYWSIVVDWTEASRLLEQLEGATRIKIERLNKTDFLSTDKQALAGRLQVPLAYGFRPLGQYAPINQDRPEEGPLDFEALAKKGSADYPLLGIVRMDVDSLGAVFSMGLKEQRTLARLVTMSRELEVFFSGYVNHLARSHDVYITYSGGDDLFAVGSWINALGFAQALRRDFDRFVCGNPNLTLSAGILFCKHDFPIGRAAELAGELEAKAKESGKNAVALFDTVVPWDRLDALLDFGAALLALVEKGDVPRSFVHRLIGLQTETREEDEVNMRVFKRNQVRLKYMVARRDATRKAIDDHLDGSKPNEKVGVLGRLVTEPELMQQIVIPASYVLYKTRNIRKGD